MIEYREKNGSGRDYTLVDCCCGKQVYKYNLKRHQQGDNHPPVPEYHDPRLAEQKEENQRRLDKIDALKDTVITRLNRQLFVEAGESASPHSMWNKALPIFTAMGHRDHANPQWRQWAQDFFVGLPSYYDCGAGMKQYLVHTRRMKDDHGYRRKIERARRRWNRARHVQQKTARAN
jgi:hypothetical protein